MSLMGRVKRWFKQLLGGKDEQKRLKGGQQKLDKGITLPAVPPQSHRDLTRQLRQALRRGETAKSDLLLQSLREQYPVPTADIVRKEVWGWNADKLVLRTHAKADGIDAVRNVESTGRKLTGEERTDLCTIMLHSCWWSPTAAEHRNDSWMRYLQFTYPQLEGLQPVLDSLIWPDEITRYPIGLPPLPPWLFLLATATRFYVYNFQDGSMMEAGENMRDVLDGLKLERWHGKHRWKEVPEEVEMDPRDYFPVYDNVPHTTDEHELMQELQEFPEEI
jgi:hypothetical protein